MFRLNSLTVCVCVPVGLNKHHPCGVQTNRCSNHPTSSHHHHSIRHLCFIFKFIIVIVIRLYCLNHIVPLYLCRPSCASSVFVMSSSYNLWVLCQFVRSSPHLAKPLTNRKCAPTFDGSILNKTWTTTTKHPYVFCVHTLLGPYLSRYLRLSVCSRTNLNSSLTTYPQTTRRDNAGYHPLPLTARCANFCSIPKLALFLCPQFPSSYCGECVRLAPRLRRLRPPPMTIRATCVCLCRTRV